MIAKSKKDIQGLKQAARIVVTVLSKLVQNAKPGVTTYELDQMARKYAEHFDVKPLFLGYRGFPGAICASVNNEIVHGIPSQETELKQGDLLSLDFGVKYKGYCGDSAITIPVGGTTSIEAEQLLHVSREALYAGIAQAKIGNCIGDIGHAVSSVAKQHNYGIVKEFVGHGIGHELHEDPQVPNYGTPGKGPKLVEGMVIAIEPMLNLGSGDTKVLDDDWTVVTADHSLSVHVEHMVMVTKSGPIVLSEGLPLYGEALAA